MSENINRADVTVNLKDVFGQVITDEVEITFYNQKVQSLNQRFTVKFKGATAVLPGVPAFPTSARGRQELKFGGVGEGRVPVYLRWAIRPESKEQS